jgi:hypothetical protein
VALIDPDAPHRFDPMVIDTSPQVDPDSGASRGDARIRRRISEWTRVNDSILPRSMPCMACGGSIGHPVHFDRTWRPAARRVPCPGAADPAGCSPDNPHPSPGPLGLHWVKDPVTGRTTS